jgi:hypothetical protein
VLRRDVTRAHDATRPRRAAAVHYRSTVGTQSLGVSTVCVSTARTSRPHLDRRARAPRGVRELAVAPSIRLPRLPAEARRTAP